MAVLSPRFCARALSSCGKQGPPLIVVRGPPTIATSPAAEHRLQTRKLSNCDSRAQPLRGMWDPPRPGLEPVSPAPAGRLSTIEPPGKPYSPVLKSQTFRGVNHWQWWVCTDLGTIRLLCLTPQSFLQPLLMSTRANALLWDIRKNEWTLMSSAAYKQMGQILILFLF